MAKDQTILFHSTIFGPVRSRRLGVSLGVNLLPSDRKVCSFDCIYCEAGYNAQGPGKSGLPTPEKVKADLEARLADMKAKGEPLDVITFSGNGEPTVHPQFPEIIDAVVSLRDRHFPQAKVSVLSNSTRIFSPAVADALRRVDNNILKLDSAIERTVQLLDRPNLSYRLPKVIEQLAQFSGSGIIQTMITRGSHDGEAVDNSTDEEIAALIEAYKEIGPREVMLYSLDRSTPEERLKKVPKEELAAIAARVEAAGIPCLCY